MKFYVVIDTNVIVSALYSKNNDSNTFAVIKKMYNGDIIPLYSDEVMEEYKKVLNRRELGIERSVIGNMINAIKDNGIYITPDSIDIDLPDREDIKFYELVMDKTIRNDKFLITGNIKHFPKEPIIVTPSEFMEIYNMKN